MFFAVRAFQPQLRRFLRRRLFNCRLPLVGERLAISGLLGFIWIISLYGIILGVWWIRLRDYFVDRGQKSGVLEGNHRLAAIALTGHLCDVTMGISSSLSRGTARLRRSLNCPSQQPLPFIC